MKSRSNDQMQGTGKSQLTNIKYDDGCTKFEFTCNGDQKCPKKNSDV